MVYIYLLIAIICEVFGTMLLSISENFTKPIPTISLSIAYILAFYFLTFAMKSIPIAIVYATWSGLGVFCISILSYFIHGQVLQWQSIFGLFLIVSGVILVNTYASQNMH
ncbi:MAG: QacE family quaternary ammonium compound efflux SMR transporter [Candidatus Marinimicrobia bacterium]|mgnify:FL=1|nr:QacE family quaternary ammonium compound efflux SMR transporter [Candidatus Neomarinimicrobiota bacterium]|tara:strand:- start:267 stop:596 length:330 start_codon:yes stop_codon:yes gene_type:complete